MKVALALKKNRPFAKQIIKICKKKYSKVDVFDTYLKNRIPRKLKKNSYDMIISYLSSWIFPYSILKKTKKFNINFHPAPPSYPGIGCFNFAIFNEEKFYGCTAHIMNKKVDSGKIINFKKFKIKKNETVESLSYKTYKAMYSLFKETIKKIEKKDFKYKKIKWSKTARRKKDLDSFSTIKIKTNSKNIDTFIRSTYYSGYPFPIVKINNHTFIYKKNDSKNNS